MRKRNNILIHNILKKNLLTVFWQELMFALGTLIDGIITCRFLGSMAMAAIGVNAPFASILAVFSGMIGIGCQTGCSKKIGEGKPQEVKSVYSTLLALSVVVSVAFMLVFFFFAEPIAISWGAKKAASVDSNILEMAEGYLKASAFGIPGMIIYYVLSPALILDGKCEFIRISTFTMMGVNIAGDLMNVFLFHGGMIGMGIATSLAYTLSLFILIYGMQGSKGMFSFHFSNIRTLEIPHLLYYGISKAVRRACNAFRPIFLNQVIAALCGSVGMAALSVQGNLRSFMGVISAAIAGTMLSISGVFYYEKDRESIQDVYQEAIRANFFIGVPFTLIFLVGARFFVGLYVTDSPEVTELAVLAVRCYSAALPFVIFNEIYINFFQSVGNVKMASAISVLSRIGMIAPCGIFAMYHQSTYAAFFALFFSEFLLTVVIFLGLMIHGRGRRLIERLSVTTKDFDKDIKREITIPTMTIGEALTTFPQKVYDVCIKWGLEKRRANKASLLCEEYFQYLNKNEKNAGRNANVRLIERMDGSVDLFIRNDCLLENIEEDLDAHLSDKEYMKNAISERILMLESDNYGYKNTFGLNHAVYTVK